MSDQAAEQPSVEQGSLNFGASRAADAPSEPETASAGETSAAKDAPLAEAVSESAALARSSSEPPSPEAVKAEKSKVDAAAPASEPETASEKIPHTPGKVIVLPRENRAWADHDFRAGAEAGSERQGTFGKRRIAAIAAAVALATAAGALGGAFATATFMHGSYDVAMNGGGQGGSHPLLEASLARIDADIQALKSGLDHTSKLGMSQFNKTTDRLDKLERAQAEPAAKLARLSEAVDKLRAVPVAAPAVAAAAPAASAAKEVTGSIGSTPAQQAATAVPKTESKTEAKTEPKTEVGRLPTVEGWVLRDVAYGSALIDSRRGTYEVYAGDMIPGLGRVDAIRRQDGRWVVVTSRGLIVAR